MRVYISSTTEDLGEARAAVARQIRGLGHEPVFMEEYSASVRPPVQKCLDDVAGCDLYVGLFALRYGHVPDGYQESVTELEYRKAKHCKKPLLIFMLDEDIEHWPIKWIDRDEKGVCMGKLRRELIDQKGHTVCLFKSMSDLLERVPQAICGAIGDIEHAEDSGAGDQPPPPPEKETIVNSVFQDLGIFKDRAEEVQKLQDALHGERAKLIVVVGPPGTGKTALISKISLDVEQEVVSSQAPTRPMGFDGIVYFDCRGANTQTVERLFHDLTRLLRPEDREEARNCWSDTSRSHEERFRFLFTKLQRGRFLLALDNLEDAIGPDHRVADECLRTFVEVCLTARHGLRVLAASGENILLSPEVLQHRHPFPLDCGLPLPDGVELLRELDDEENHLGLREAPEELLCETVRRCYGLPRALLSVAAILAADHVLTLKELLANCKLFTGLVVEQLAREQYERQPGDGYRRVLEALAVYGKRVPEAAVRHLVGKFFPRIDVHKVLNDLVHRYCVTANRNLGTHELQPPLLEYAYDQIPDGESGYCKKACHQAAAEYFAASRKPGEWKTPEDIQPQMDEFGQWVLAGRYDEAARVVDLIDEHYLQPWGQFRTVVFLREQLLGDGKLTDHTLLHSNFGSLGLMYRRTGRLRDCPHCFEQAIEHAKLAGDMKAMATWYCELANYYADDIQMERALELYELALRIAEENNDLRNQSRLLGNVAIARRQLGDASGALPCYQRAMEIDRTMIEQAPDAAAVRAATRWLGLHLGNSAKPHIALGDPAKAIEVSQEAIELLRDVGSTLAEAAMLEHIGEAEALRGSFQAAVGFFQQSIDLLKTTGETRSTSYSLDCLGSAYHHLGDRANARACYERARNLDVPETRFHCEVMLAVLDLEEGDQESAKRRLAAAIGQCRELLQKTSKYYEAIYRQALAMLASRDKDAGLRTYREALAVCKAGGEVQLALQELSLLRRAAPDTPGLDEAHRLLEAALAETDGP